MEAPSETKATIEREQLQAVAVFESEDGQATALARDRGGQVYHVRGARVRPVSLARSVELFRGYDRSPQVTGYDCPGFNWWLAAIVKALRAAE